MECHKQWMIPRQLLILTQLFMLNDTCSLHPCTNKRAKTCWKRDIVPAAHVSTKTKKQSDNRVLMTFISTSNVKIFVAVFYDIS